MNKKEKLWSRIAFASLIIFFISGFIIDSLEEGTLITQIFCLFVFANFGLFIISFVKFIARRKERLLAEEKKRLEKQNQEKSMQREMEIHRLKSLIEENKNIYEDDLDNEWHRAYISYNISGQPEIDFKELEFKVIDDGVISENRVNRNERLYSFASSIYDNNKEMCKLAFLQFPNKFFLYYTNYIMCDEMYLNYTYNVDYSNYFKESLEKGQKYLIDFNNAFEKFILILKEDFNVSDDDSKAVTWIVLKKVACEFYDEKWCSDYDAYCKISPSDCDSIEELLDSYCRCVEFNPFQIENISVFTHHTIFRNGLDNKSFVLGFDALSKLVVSHKDKMELNTFRKSIDLNLVDELNKGENIIKYTIDDVDMMNGNEFEHFVSLLYTKMGYITEVTKQSGDQGLDVIAEKNGKRIGVQAKCYSNTVSNSAIQEAVAGKNFYNCDKVIVITNNTFTSSAIELAQVNDVVLWDRSILKEKISEMF